MLLNKLKHIPKIYRGGTISITGNGISDLRSDPGQSCESIVGQTMFFSLGKATSLGEGKTLNSNQLYFA